MKNAIIRAAITALVALFATPSFAAAPQCPAAFKQGGKPADRELVVACLLERLFSQGSTRLGDLLADEAVLIEADGTPYPGRYSGERLRGFDRIFNATWRDVSVRVEDIYTSDQGAVALIRLAGTLTASGQRVEMPILERYLFAPDGRVTLIEPFYFDTYALRRAAARKNLALKYLMKLNIGADYGFFQTQSSRSTCPRTRRIDAFCRRQRGSSGKQK